ncbi:hypothetical protein D3C71_2164110 [compost metagenome]
MPFSVKVAVFKITYQSAHWLGTPWTVLLDRLLIVTYRVEQPLLSHFCALPLRMRFMA